MALETGERAPNVETVCCDGQTFRSVTLDDVLGERGAVLVSTGFVYSAIARNWWKRFLAAGWEDFDGVPVVGFTRDGPYAQNAFLRWLGEPSFLALADVNATVADALDILTARDHMANVSTPASAAFVLDTDRTVQFAHVSEQWMQPFPREEIERAVADL